MSADLRKRLAEMLRHVESTEGWRITRMGRHYKVLGPSGQMVTCSVTPSDYRALKNIRGDLRRNGAPLPTR